MKECEICGTAINEKYKWCVECNKKQGEDKSAAALQAIAKHLEHINWNLGMLVSIVKKDGVTFNKIEKEFRAAEIGAKRPTV